MSTTIWTKFYWQDWLADASLRRCSYQARGLWMDLLCIAAQHVPIGYVAVGGKGLSMTDIARMTGGSELEVCTLLEELDLNGVLSRDRNGTLYNRRMVRDAKRSKTATKNGKLGGNPKLCKQTEISGSDNLQDKSQVKTQELRAMSYEKKEDNPDREQPSPPRVAALYDELEAKCREAAGLENDPSPGLFVIGPIADLVEAGWSLERHVLPALKAAKASGRKGRSWAYYVPAITDGGKSPPKGKPPPNDPEKPDLRKRLVHWQSNGFWHSSWGPKPGEPGSEITAEMATGARAA